MLAGRVNGNEEASVIAVSWCRCRNTKRAEVATEQGIFSPPKHRMRLDNNGKMLQCRYGCDVEKGRPLLPFLQLSIVHPNPHKVRSDSHRAVRQHGHLEYKGTCVALVPAH
ncbi:hypothetical protein EmuJ_001147300 [Echinococcus multilocularis]|uniref:Uncharacterized protein n=1 Tax=Echinococcus multilocularis TaxID=6211 RepID=A0A068YGI3_ECHMU|nr:hypothetical protein EmuJ_001147300 [Echinococcus multilocularis]